VCWLNLFIAKIKHDESVSQKVKKRSLEGRSSIESIHLGNERGRFSFLQLVNSSLLDFVNSTNHSSDQICLTFVSCHPNKHLLRLLLQNRRLPKGCQSHCSPRLNPRNPHQKAKKVIVSFFAILCAILSIFFWFSFGMFDHLLTVTTSIVSLDSSILFK
jgi:hypothetical protein